MEHQEIIENIQSRFRKTDRWGNKRRIVFWIDKEGEFKDSINTEFNFGEVQLLVFDKYNGFQIKYLIEHKDPESKYLIYIPFECPKDEKNILADMMHYCGTPFSADKASMICMELQIDVRYSDLIKEHIKFFNSSERRKKIQSSDFDLDSEEDIRCAMMAVTLGCQRNDIGSILEEILRRYASDPSPEQASDIFAKLEDYELKMPFWRICSREYGTPIPNPDKIPSLGELVRIFFVSYLANKVNLSEMPSIKQYISEKKARIFTFINGMYNDSKYAKVTENLSSFVEKKLKIRPLLEMMDVRSLADSDAFSCIDEIIIDSLISQINSTAKPLDSNDVRMISSRKKLHYGGEDHYKSQYEMIENGTLLLDATSEFFNKISITNTPKAILDGYAQSWYKVDRFYRDFIYYSDKIDEKTDSMDKFIEFIENTYNNRFLDILTEKLCCSVKAYKDLPVPYQTSFYNHYVKNTDRAIVVIISDAFRYECAAELSKELEMTSRVSDQKLEYIISTLPSITKFGMAALLPNSGLEVSHDGKYSIMINGQSTDGTNARERILQSENKDSVAITYKEVMSSKQEELRTRCAGRKIIYIYHDAVDATGDNAASEYSTFDACHRAVNEIKGLFTRIVNFLSYTKFIITADHGFIYRRKQMEEVDKVFVSNNITADKRYALTDKSNGMMNSIEFPLDYLQESNTGLFVSVPSSSKIFKTSGRGQNFVHGGLSPQEVVVPVLTVLVAKGKIKEEYVGINPPIKRDIKKRKQSFDFLQINPVSDKYREATYEVYFTNEYDVKISDVRKIEANKKEGEDQWFGVQFIFRDDLKKGKAYLHINNTLDSDDSKRIEFNYNIIMPTLEGL